MENPAPNGKQELHTLGSEVHAMVQQLEMENAQLRAKLQSQYQLMVHVTDTIAKEHLSRIKQAASTLSDPMSLSELCSDYDEKRQSLETQRQLLSAPTVDPAKQAAQLRALEETARKWAKKFLHKTKASAAAAEYRVGLAASGCSTTAGTTMASAGAAAEPVQGAGAARNGHDGDEHTPASPPQPGGTSKWDMGDSINSEEPRLMEELRATAESMRSASRIPRNHPQRHDAANSQLGSKTARETDNLDTDLFGTFDTRASESEDLRMTSDIGLSGSLSGKQGKRRTIFNRLFSHRPR